MKHIITLFLVFSFTSIFCDEYNNCRSLSGTEAFSCFNDILSGNKQATDIQKIYAAIYITKTCKDGSLPNCTYDYMPDAISLAEKNGYNEIIYDLRYYHAVSLFLDGRMNHKSELISESNKILLDIVDNIDKLNLIYPYVVFMQLWNNYHELDSDDEALTYMELAFKTAPNNAISKSIGEKLFIFIKSKAEPMLKQYCKNGLCDIDKCKEALYLFRRLEKYESFGLDEIPEKIKADITYGINISVGCVFKDKQPSNPH